MMTYIRNNRQSQFLLAGTCLMVVGFVLGAKESELSSWSYYLAVVCLGYFATKQAIHLSLKERKVNVDLLMVLAAIGALSIGEEVEATVLLFIFAAAEVLERYVTDRSSSAITSLMEAVPKTAQLVGKGNHIQTVSTDQLQLGDLVLVSKGAQIPIDGFVSQATTVSEMALTGEASPVEKQSGQEVFAGTVNLGEPVQVEVGKRSDQTVFSNIVRLVQEAQEQPSQLARWIDHFEGWYVIAVLVTVPLFIIALMVIQELGWQDAFYRGMVLLTVASPCALVASVTPATLSAISRAAKLGVLVKGGQAMGNLAEISVLYTDKTGTLTEGKFKVVNLSISTENQPLLLGMTSHSQHPISQAISQYLLEKGVVPQKMTAPIEEHPGQGLQAGPYQLLNRKAVATLSDPSYFFTQAAQFLTTSFLTDGKEILGFIALEDQLRPEAIRAVQAFQKEGIRVEMLTGDNERVAEQIAAQAGIDQFEANCLPTDKATRVQETVQTEIVAMIGDGINDAPALAHAHLGVAMGSGSAIAMETADLVMVQNNLAKFYDVYQMSRKLKRIIIENVGFAVGVMIILIVLNVLGILDLTLGVIFHEGSTILVILNGLRLLKWQSDL
ncbi:heavy metal translocating P-type ATPase [Streptococcus moroccensis]|uniref:Cd2+/Zn2+-exporting ATPase n=1 Tax=Streptococcus moroccensis TaxID=1451356 RepID=A0ABT9YT44_9STRE|nr:heavy metal translocating P-type ATPase [Streptococcus moroccensis]MDQ0223138.1 Cd2+/Zn2+-exporting ATPase [Streptococcus moroccensis]